MRYHASRKSTGFVCTIRVNVKSDERGVSQRRSDQCLGILLL